MNCLKFLIGADCRYWPEAAVPECLLFRRPAVMDYPPCHRKMERAGIIGDTPY
jgi:hypothetical protein